MELGRAGFGEALNRGDGDSSLVERAIARQTSFDRPREHRRRKCGRCGVEIAWHKGDAGAGEGKVGHHVDAR